MFLLFHPVIFTLVRLKSKELENVSIKDVLPLKAARRDAISNLKCFGASDTRDENFDYIYIHYAAPPYSARISAIYFFQFGNIWLGSFSRATHGKLNAEFSKGG